MDILNIIIGACAAHQVTQVKQRKDCHSSFSNPSATLPTSQLIPQPFRCFTYVICTSPTSQLILQPFRRFTSVTGHSTFLPLLHLRHRPFTNFSWRAAHAQGDEKNILWWTSLLQQVTKFRSSYSFGQLLRILLRAVNLFS